MVVQEFYARDLYSARVSYKNPKTKKMVDVLVGTEERLYKTNQKADSEADARLIGEAAIRNANRRKVQCS